MSRIASVLSGALALALALTGCVGSGPNAGTNQLLVINRSPDDISVEIVPLGIEDPTTSPMYKKLDIARGGHAKVRLVAGQYSIVAVQDDWERPQRRRIDIRLSTDGVLAVAHRARMTYEEEPDNPPIFMGHINH